MFSQNHPPKSPLFDFYSPLGNHFRGVLSIPHSGETIPPEFLPFLSGDIQAYKEDIDFKVNELVDIRRLQEAGIAVMVSNIHRICVDLNRAESNCVLFWKDNTQGKKLVTVDPNEEQTRVFIEKYHWPYYELLRSLLNDFEKRKTGLVSMVDLHSMPSAPTAYHMKQNPNQKTHRPDFCLSDRKGKTCVPEFISHFENNFKLRGFETTQNDPYVGGFVTEYVDHFRTNNIQIEIKREIYMDEKTKLLIPNKVATLKPQLTDVLISGFTKFDS
jgi:N-formylglutamate amidohydrolase